MQRGTCVPYVLCWSQDASVPMRAGPGRAGHVQACSCAGGQQRQGPACPGEARTLALPPCHPPAGAPSHRSSLPIPHPCPHTRSSCRPMQPVSLARTTRPPWARWCLGWACRTSARGRLPTPRPGRRCAPCCAPGCRSQVGCACGCLCLCLWGYALCERGGTAVRAVPNSGGYACGSRCQGQALWVVWAADPHCSSHSLPALLLLSSHLPVTGSHRASPAVN